MRTTHLSSIALVAASAILTGTVAISQDHRMTDSDLPNFDTWWDYQDPAATEAKFRGHLEVARAAGDPGYLAELLSQIARTQGLQQQFDAAHATLDEAEALLTDATDQARVRCHLERGRAVNSAGKPADSIPHFEKALAAAEAAGLEYYAVDAAHMLGIVHPEAIRWNEQALALAERATERPPVAGRPLQQPRMDLPRPGTPRRRARHVQKAPGGEDGRREHDPAKDRPLVDRQDVSLPGPRR